MGYVPNDCIKRKFMRNAASDPKPDGSLPNASERQVRLEATIKSELEEVIMKVNYHFHSGYEHNDARKPESIFMNFFKKQPSVIHSSYLMRMKNRDFQMKLDEGKFVSSISFNDLAYDGWNKMTDLVKLLNDAASQLDYDALREGTNRMDKFYQITDKSIQSIKDFKFS